MSNRNLLPNANNDYGTLDRQFPVTTKTVKDQIHDQDVMIDELGNIVSDIKNLASHMNDEITSHNDTIVDLNNHTDETTNTIANAKDRVKIIEDNENCCCWIKATGICVFFGFLILAAIIIVYAVKYRSPNSP